MKLKKWMFFIPIIGGILVLMYSDRIYNPKYNLKFTLLEVALIGPIAGISWGIPIALFLVNLFS